MDRGSRPKDAERADPPRLWKVAEANARIDELSELLPRLRGWVVRLGQVHDQRKHLGDFWGRELEAADHPDHELKGHLDAEWQNLTRHLDEAVGSLRREGIELKDLESGLVDFYGLVDGELVFLCWQRGESSVRYYHPVTGGYRDRRPLPEAGRPSASAPVREST